MSDDQVLRDAVRDFKRSVEITRDVRFQANLRLSSRQQGSSYIVAFLSLYVIALSLIQNILILSRAQSQILLACSIVLSVFVIFTSLIDGTQNYFHQGELLHQCARKIATVHHDLKNIDIDFNPALANQKFLELQVKYRQALDECPINHGNVDFIREMGWKPQLFPANYPNNQLLFYLVLGWNRLRSFLLGWSWMTIHAVAIVVVSWVVFEFVLNGASLRAM